MHRALYDRNVFIGGPIQHAISSAGFHSDLQSLIEIAIEVAASAGANVFSAHKVERFGVDTPSFTPRAVSQRDFDWMRRCDVFVPILPVSDEDMLLRTDGTHIELGWASAFNKPIIAITKLPIVDSGSHLLKGLPHIAEVDLFDEADFRLDPQQLITRIEHMLITTATRRPLPAAAVPVRQLAHP